MALIPLLLDYLDRPAPRPSRILDQHFGHGLTQADLTRPRDVRELTPHYYRPWRHSAASQDAGSTLHFDKDKFRVDLDVQQFGPEEITVKVIGDNQIIVEGKHEEKADEHGFVQRHFVRRYILPEGHDVEKIQSRLSSDGVLSVIAPKIDDEQADHRHIPIEHTGRPSRAVEKSENEQK